MKVKWVAAPGCLHENGVYGGVSFQCLKDPNFSHYLMFTPIITPYKGDWVEQSTRELEELIKNQNKCVWTRQGDTLQTLTLEQPVVTYRRQRVCCVGRVVNGEFVEP